MTVDDGTPGTANAFLGWDTRVAAGEVWKWEGEVPLAGGIFMGRVGRWLTIYVGAQEGRG
jgi:hypothetical protein